MILHKKVSKMLKRVFLLIKRIGFMIQIHEFLQSLTRTNIPFLVSKRERPTFSDLGNFLNINLKTDARTSLDILIILNGKKSEDSYSSTALSKAIYFNSVSSAIAQKITSEVLILLCYKYITNMFTSNFNELRRLHQQSPKSQ